MEDKLLVLITGNIAAGKSTFAVAFLETYKEFNCRIISADLFYENLFSKIEDMDKRYMYAKEHAYCELAQLIKCGQSFIWEAVLTDIKQVNVLMSAYESGYKIICYEVQVQNLDKLIERSNNRHEEGCYFVNGAKINDRSNKQNIYLSKANDIFDIHIVVYNEDSPNLAVLKKTVAVNDSSIINLFADKNKLSLLENTMINCVQRKMRYKERINYLEFLINDANDIN
ncbi:MAG: hypothetical protein R3Y65_00785 [Bacillota bacterium]